MRRYLRDCVCLMQGRAPFAAARTLCRLMIEWSRTPLDSRLGLHAVTGILLLPLCLKTNGLSAQRQRPLNARPFGDPWQQLPLARHLDTSERAPR